MYKSGGFGRLTITFEDLKDLLDLPKDWTIVAVDPTRLVARRSGDRFLLAFSVNPDQGPLPSDARAQGIHKAACVRDAEIGRTSRRDLDAFNQGHGISGYLEGGDVKRHRPHRPVLRRVDHVSGRDVVGADTR